MENKRILFLSASFFGYQYEIEKCMEVKGYQVDYFDERPSNTAAVKALIRINPKLIRKYIDRYHHKIIDQTSIHKYDYVVVIKAEAISERSLKELREQHPEARFVLYLWDNFNNFVNGDKKIKYFDKVLTFDLSDAQQYGLCFRPLFFLPAYQDVKYSAQPKDIDILFVGTMHSDRYQFLQQIRNQAKALSKMCYYFLFFMSTVLYYKMKIGNPLVRKIKKSEFQFKPLNQQQIIGLFCRSRVIIDIQHPKQTGLTMRTIETLGAGRKLITTNPMITQYDFYNPNNIVVVDRESPVVTADFLSSAYQEVDTQISNRYSLAYWLEEVLSR